MLSCLRLQLGACHTVRRRAMTKTTSQGCCLRKKHEGTAPRYVHAPHPTYAARIFKKQLSDQQHPSTPMANAGDASWVDQGKRRFSLGPPGPLRTRISAEFFRHPSQRPLRALLRALLGVPFFSQSRGS